MSDLAAAILATAIELGYCRHDVSLLITKMVKVVDDVMVDEILVTRFHGHTRFDVHRDGRKVSAFSVLADLDKAKRILEADLDA